MSPRQIGSCLDNGLTIAETDDKGNARGFVVIDTTHARITIHGSDGRRRVLQGFKRHRPKHIGGATHDTD